MNKLRVLHIVQNLNYGGMERLIAYMVQLADRSQFDMHVLGLQYLGRFSTGLEEIATLHVAPPMHRLSLLRPTGLATEIARIAPDIVHSHSGVWLKAARAAKMAGVPLTVHTEHGRRSPDPLSDRILDGLGSRYTDNVVAVSEKLAEHLVLKLGIPKSKVSFISNGVDTRSEPGDPKKLRRELGISDSTTIIGSVGRLEPIKGYSVAVEALAHLDRPDVALVVAGDGSEQQNVRTLAENLGVADRLYLLGWRDDTNDLHAASAFFTMSSHSEGTSVSLLEAMARGLCPVVTDVGGNRAVLGAELAHRLVPANNPAALAQAWGAALDDSARRNADGATARRRVEEKFSIDTMVRAYEALYLRAFPAARRKVS